jgi:hypothetical protein
MGVPSIGSVRAPGTATSSAGRFDQVGNAVIAQPARMLQCVQAVVVDQRGIRARRQQALDYGRVPLHGGQYQGGAARRVGRIEGGALLEKALHLRQITRARRVLQCACQ